jgi:heterotetrameric sarcosine oxidase gamma subunit
MSDAVLAEPVARGKLVVGGRHLPGALSSAGLSLEPGRVTAATGVEVWATAPDEALLVLAAGEDWAAHAAPLQAAGAAVTDLGAGLVELRLSGSGVRRVLEELCPVDLGEAAAADGAIVHAPLAGTRVTFARQDHDGVPGFTILVSRDLSEWLRDELVHAGAVPA